MPILIKHAPPRFIQKVNSLMASPVGTGSDRNLKWREAALIAAERKPELLDEFVVSLKALQNEVKNGI